MKTKLTLIAICFIFSFSTFGTETEFNIGNRRGDSISVTYTQPDNYAGKIVLFIAGSGPTDRNCNGLGFESNAYKMVSDELQKNGIATLRYDKLGVGKSIANMVSVKSEKDMHFNFYIEDAVDIINYLKSTYNPTHIIILGHSEGSLIGMMAAQQTSVSGFISIAGPGRKAGDVIREQLATQPDSMKTQAYQIISSLENGQRVGNIPRSQAMLFRPSIQQYMIEWFSYDPAKEIQKLKCPVVVIQGGRDLQVSMLDASILGKAAGVAVVKIGKMNHVLKDAPSDRAGNMATYNNPDLPLNKGLVPAILDLVKQLK